MPADRPPMLTAAANVPLLLPVVVPLRLRKLPLATAVDQLSVPPPVLLTMTTCTAGLGSPCTAVKDREVGLRLMTGAGGLTIRVTGISCGVFDAPGAVTSMTP